MAESGRSPHFADHAAAFVESTESAYVLVGEILRSEPEPGVATFHQIAGQDLVRSIEKTHLPTFEFFAIPRSQSQAKNWMAWAETPEGALAHIMKLGFLVGIDTRTATTASSSLKGLRLVSRARQGAQEVSGFFGVMAEGSTFPVSYVSPELAAALWHNSTGLDVPSFVKLVSKTTGENRDLVARKILTAVPRLIEQGHVKLEWIRVPVSPVVS